MKPTITDVASYAKVSKSTVSQYLNKRYNYMSETTRKRIEQAIETLNYQPNQIAKSLKQKKTNIIAIICSTLLSRFSLELIAEIETYYQEKQYSVIVANTWDDPIKERELVKSMIARQVDGIIVFPTEDNYELYKNIKKYKQPIVFVDRHLDHLEIPSVLLDNRMAGQIATQHLISNGHRNIAIMTFPLGNNITTRVERLNGYYKALADNNLNVMDEFVINCTLNEVPERLTMFLNSPSRPSALILTNDMLLEATLVWVKKNNLIIPDDLSIIGIDDVSYAELFTPSITTLLQPTKKIGKKAAEILFNQIEGDHSLNQKLEYSPELIVRNSVKKTSL